MSVTKRDAIAHMIAQLDITERCIAGAEDPKARAILENSAESFRMAIAAMQRTLPSNADRIRAMSDEELAKWTACPYDTCGKMPPYDGANCAACVLEWLKQPAEEEPA